jgi:hypothetical protein
MPAKGQRKWRHAVDTRTYRAWNSMIRRCCYPEDSCYPQYGAVGVTVCERWHDYDVFHDDMGECPNGMTLDRIDGTKGYELGNTRWATPKEQARNTRRNRMLTFNGRTQCMAAWAEELGLNSDTISIRLSRGDSVERALRTLIPVSDKR